MVAFCFAAILTGKNAPEDSLDATLWRTAVDSSTGKTYFFHTKTKQTVWSLDEVPVWGRAKDAASGDFYWYNTRNGEVTVSSYAIQGLRA